MLMTTVNSARAPSADKLTLSAGQQGPVEGSSTRQQGLAEASYFCGCVVPQMWYYGAVQVLPKSAFVRTRALPVAELEANRTVGSLHCKQTKSNTSATDSRQGLASSLAWLQSLPSLQQQLHTCLLQRGLGAQPSTAALDGNIRGLTTLEVTRWCRAAKPSGLVSLTQGQMRRCLELPVMPLAAGARCCR